MEASEQQAKPAASPDALSRTARVLIPVWFGYMVVTLPVFGWMIVSAAAIEHPWLLSWYWTSVALNFLLVVAVACVVGRDKALGRDRTMWVVAVVFTGALGATVYWWRHLRTPASGYGPNPI